MPFFQSLAEIIANLTPRRGQPDDQHRPDDYSHHEPEYRFKLNSRRLSNSQTSPPDHSRHLRSSGHQYTLSSEVDDNQSFSHRVSPICDSAARLQSIKSYDNALPHSTENTTIRGLSRLSPSHSVIEPSVCGSDTPQMLGRNQRRKDAQARQEEARLLGARDYNDKNAVPIMPGATLGRTKIPGSFGAFKPTDRITQNARQSGPVRASGTSKPSAFYLSRPRTQQDDEFDFEESSRPHKRRRNDASSKHPDHTDDISNRPGSQAGANVSGKHKRNGLSPRQHDEFRTVEESIRVDRSPRVTRRHQHIRFPSEDSDEHFTLRATQQRRSLSNVKEGHRQQELEAVGIPRSRAIAAETTKSRSQFNRGEGLSPSISRRISEGRESPDELQGEATTQPIPKDFDGKNDQIRRKLLQDQRSPIRKRSPSDIQPTDFTGSQHQGSKKTKRNRNCSGPVSLDVLFIRYGDIIKRTAKGESAAILLHQDKIELGEDVTGKTTTEILLRHIVGAQQGIAPSHRVRLMLSRHSAAPGHNQVDIEFLMDLGKSKLIQVLQSSQMQIKIQDKDDAFMEKAFAHSERELAQCGTPAKRPLVGDSADGSTLPATTRSGPRQKLSFALQGSTGESSEGQRAQDKHNIQRRSDETQVSSEATNRRNAESNDGVEIPVKPFRPRESERESRVTRRTTRLSEKSPTRDNNNSSFERQPAPLNDEARKKWGKPLVYPRVGKKKAEVNVEDRDRLRDDEFLNDNLIGFYMRFLQDHLERTNKQAAQRVYFFNSYFYDTLTKTSKGDRGINYGGVEKWTRNVDLFCYDYIVVPINENAHWYVAIICNLPSLQLDSADAVESSPAEADGKETSVQPDSEVQEIPESPDVKEDPSSKTIAEADLREEPTSGGESPLSQEARESLETMTLGERRQAQNEAEKQAESTVDEWADSDEKPPLASATFPSLRPRTPHVDEKSAAASEKGRKFKKKGKAGPKLSPGQTTVITFDSLDLARSPTIRMLREYICKEAVSKRGVEVSPTAIKGMRARQIPLQPNFSDCGLYLLAYVERFIQEPDTFITKLLRREMDEKDDWPPLGSGLLRHRLRNFLDDLYDEQASVKKDKGESRPIMADQQPVCFLLGPAQLSRDTGGEDKKVEEHAKAEDPSKTTNATGESSTKGTSPPAKENEVPSEDLAADQPQLVSVEKASTARSRRARVSPERSPAKIADAGNMSSAKEQDIIEVPDSQEKGVAQGASSQAESKRSPVEKVAGRNERSRSKRSERKKAAIPVDSDVVNVESPIPEEPGKQSELDVEVQVRQTPPPSGFGRGPMN